MNASENPSAFPVAWDEQNEHGVKFPFIQTGMTLRDYFAGQALIGASMEVARAGESVEDMRVGITRSAYQLADAMLAERAKVRS